MAGDCSGGLYRGLDQVIIIDDNSLYVFLVGLYRRFESGIGDSFLQRNITLGNIVKDRLEPEIAHLGLRFAVASGPAAVIVLTAAVLDIEFFGIFPVDDSLEAVKTLRRISESGYAVIFITEALASQIQTELDRYKDEPLPAIIPIPGINGNTGIGMKQVSSFVERAVGSDIVK